MLSSTLQGVIKRTLNVLGNVYCNDATGMHAGECLVLDPWATQLGKFCVCPGQQISAPGKFQAKKAEHFEG